MSQIHEASGLSQFSSDLAEIAERVAPAVVRVDDGSRLTATGIIWSQEGLIVTTSHGVEREENLAVQTHDGKMYEATLLGRDHDTDLAVLKVHEESFSGTPILSSDSVKVGNLVLAMAQPGRSGLQTTLGIVSSRTETERAGRPEYLLSTDADLHPGFSGAPLVNMDGAMVGLINLAFGRGKGIALGTPIVANIVESILKSGSTKRGYLGIRTQQIALPEVYQTLAGAEEQETGLLVMQVEPNSPAQKAGLFIGDVLLSMDGVQLDSVEALRHHLRKLIAGAAINLKVASGGIMKEVSLTLGAEG